MNNLNGRTNEKINEKFCRLMLCLTQTTIHFEMIAEEVEDYNLRTALYGVASEGRQYASELNSQLKRLHIDYVLPSINFLRNIVALNAYPSSPSIKGGEILSICRGNESSLTKSYKDLLNEFSSFPFLEQMMTYQLNGIKNAFERIRLLNIIRFN